MTPEKLDELSRLCKLATRGQLRINRYDNTGGSISWQVQHEKSGNVIFESNDFEDPRAKRDAELFVAAVEWMPELIELARDGLLWRQNVSSAEGMTEAASDGSRVLGYEPASEDLR